MVATAETKRQAGKVARRLAVDYADATCALVFHSPLELLVATILSAQCTDVRVNQVTLVLFKKYRGAGDYARAKLSELEKDVQPTGFFRNKAKNIRACCQKLLDEHDGEVPRSMDALVALPGVGRKTANVVLGTAFGVASGVVVDTHVARLSRRLGLTEQTTPEKIERDLMEQLSRRGWVAFSHRMIHHGRAVCQARRPRCQACSMKRFCPQVGVAVGAG